MASQYLRLLRRTITAYIYRMRLTIGVKKSSNSKHYEMSRPDILYERQYDRNLVRHRKQSNQSNKSHGINFDQRFTFVSHIEEAHSDTIGMWFIIKNFSTVITLSNA